MRARGAGLHQGSRGEVYGGWVRRFKGDDGKVRQEPIAASRGSARKPKGATHFRARVEVWPNGSAKPKDISRIAPTKERAMEAARKAATELLAGTGDGLRADSPFGDAVSAYFTGTTWGSLKESTRSHYRAAYTAKLDGAPLLGKTISAVNRGTVLGAYLRGLGSYERECLTIIRGALQLAVGDDAITHNAAMNVKVAERPKVRHGHIDNPKRALTDDEWANVLTVAKERAEEAREADTGRETGPGNSGRARLQQSLYEALVVLRATGIREGELLDLEWSEVDLAGGSISITKGKSKAAERTIPVGASVVELLKERRRRQGLKSKLVFPAPGMSTPSTSNPSMSWAPIRNGKRDASNFTSAMRKLFDAADLPWARTHTLRHTYAATLHDQGEQLTTISRLMGHANPSVTLREYAWAKPDQDLSAAVVEVAI